MGSARAARCTRARTYLLAAAAAGVGLGVRRRAAAAPGRGVKVPGIILVHDPRWGLERKQGVFLSPPWPRPRTGCCALAPCGLRLGCSLRSAASPARRPREPGGGDTREQWPPRAERCTSFLLDQRRGTRSLPLTSRRGPRSLPCARPPAPARSRSPAGTAGSIKNWKSEKKGSPASHASRVCGPPISGRAKEGEKKGCPLGETSISSF